MASNQKTINTKIYHMEWERIVIDFSQENWLSLCADSLDQGADYGVYQLYGDHPIYGNDVLLYIGKARDQRFKYRLNQHLEWYENNIKRYTRVHVGRILQQDSGTDESWGKAIDDIEQVLIASHNPALNKQLVNKVIQDDMEHFIVLNWNDYGSISAEVSSLRFSYHYWNTDEYEFKRLSE